MTVPAAALLPVAVAAPDYDHLKVQVSPALNPDVLSNGLLAVKSEVVGALPLLYTESVIV